MPDANTDLSKVSTSYPLAFVLAWLGAMILPIAEAAVLQSRHDSTAAAEKLDHGVEMGKIVPSPFHQFLHHGDGKDSTCESCEQGDCHNCDLPHDPCDQYDRGHDPHGHSTAKADQPCTVHQPVEHHGHGHSHDALALALVEQESVALSIKAYMLEFSIAVHSFIMGFTLGASQSTALTAVLMIAYGFHQYFEGLSVGLVISDRRLNFPTWKITTFALLFSAILSFGIVIGIAVTAGSGSGSGDHESAGRLLASGCSNAIAAGMLLYIGFVEMIAEELGKHHCEHKNYMILSVLMGGGLMSLLAIWA